MTEKRATTPARPDHRVTVDILGEKYTVRGEADPAYIAEVANLVDSRMRELKSTFPGMTRQRLAVLAALNIADEMKQNRREMEKLSGAPPVDEDISRRTHRLISLLDEGLIGDHFPEEIDLQSRP